MKTSIASGPSRRRNEAGSRADSRAHAPAPAPARRTPSHTEQDTSPSSRAPARKPPSTSTSTGTCTCTYRVHGEPSPSLRPRFPSGHGHGQGHGHGAFRLLCPFLLFLGCADDPPTFGSDAGRVGTCEFDDSYGPDSPLADDPRDEVMGWLCPLEDEDWYALDVPASDTVVRVELEALGSRSPAEPVYALWERDGDAPGEVVARADADDAGRPLQDAHCVAPGAYFLAIRDQGDDAQDRRDPYRLHVTSEPEPDANEPNEDVAGATPARLGEVVTAYVACAGDRDVYSLRGEAGQVLVARLGMGETGIVPALRIYDGAGELVVEATNPAAERGEPTSLVLSRVLPAGGDYTVVVEDTQGRRGDPDAPYELSVQLLDDLDGNEPNDHPTDATPLAADPQRCEEGSWTSFTATGTVGSEGDDDWFVLPTTGCGGAGLIEAEVTVAASGGLAEQWQTQRAVQASISLVRPHDGSPCGEDGACSGLQQVCEHQWMCEGLFNTCLPDGVCAGATVCMPGGLCGANQIQRSYRAAVVPDAPTEPPPPNTARFVAPLLDDGPVYLRVGDFQGNGGDPDALYTLTVRLRRDPDGHDGTARGNNLYTPRTLEDVPAAESAPRAVEIPVHDCAAGDCCGDGDWISGSIGYEHDLDWFLFEHPCPGEDCNLRIHYQVDGGPVDHALWVYRDGGRGWISRELASGTRGVIGGVGAEAESCAYAYHEHGGAYLLMLRDREDDATDADPDQGYRFCVEKAANGCQAPCMDYGPDRGGCGVPR